MSTRGKLTPEMVIQQLRAIRAQIEEQDTPLSSAERRDLRNRTKTSEEVVIASIGAMGTSGKVATAVGYSVPEVMDIIKAREQWGLVEGELRGFLNGVSSANLARKRQLDLIATQAFAITKQLVRSPENADLIAHLEEMQRLRKLERPKPPTRKKKE
jgi:hypothetical protein